MLHDNQFRPVEEACLWFGTSKLDEIADFYSQINEVISRTVNKNFSYQDRITKIIIDSTVSHLTGLAFFVNRSTKEELKDPDDRPVKCYPTCDNYTYFWLGISNVINVFRCSSIEQTKNFYSSFGMWTEEQHGNGPKHYSAHWQGVFTELYPRKIENSVEFLFLTENPSLTFSELENYKFPVKKKRDDQFFLYDPDGRLIKFITIQSHCRDLNL